MPKRRHNEQLVLRFSPLQNHSLFSNHWLRNRLQFEPEWDAKKESAKAVLDQILELWTIEKDRVEHYQTEQSLEYAFIQPIIQKLGWKLIYQTYIRRRKPDYALFHDDEQLDNALRVGKDSSSFWDYPKVLADAKAWNISLDRPSYIRNEKEYPPEQIEWYLNNSNIAYAILTNGRLWRLIPRNLHHDQPRFQTYLQFDLLSFIKDWNVMPGLLRTSENPLFNDFLTFYLFFSPVAYYDAVGATTLVDRASQGSTNYRLGIGKDIKSRVFEALRISIEGFLKYSPNMLNAQEHLSLCRENSFILLYRLLFIMFAEDRALLPYRLNRLYTENRSLGRLRSDIEGRIDIGNKEDYSYMSTEIWEELLNLFDLINVGKATYQVPAYNGGLFDSDANLFLLNKKMSDWYMSRIIDQLSRARDENHPHLGLFRVDYHDLQIQHLGNIYESLLELHPHVVSEPLIVIRNKATCEERVIKENDAIPRGHERTEITYATGSIHLLTQKGERRASGSYYTPDHIVDDIVGKCLSPLCKSINEGLISEIERFDSMLITASDEGKEDIKDNLSRLRTEFDDRVLKLRILDPSMGSGHFLLKACHYLAEEIATNPYTGDVEYDSSMPDEASIIFWKRKVVERCLYGVDINPLAVELAKLALWLETVSVGQPLTFLDHHLKCGNSLVGSQLDKLGVLPRSGKIFEHALNEHWSNALPDLLEPLERISNAPSITLVQIKEKEKAYRQVFQQRLFPFNRIADIWCSSFYVDDSMIPPDEYQRLLKLSDKPRKFKEKLISEEWIKHLISISERPDNLFFHWELEFPDVFFKKADRGFDAIIGNPPYDVLSEREIGYNIDSFKQFIESQPFYNASRRGKNNLYKLFICKALDLLANNGRLGFIVQMALLGDDQACDIRKELLSQGAFTSIEAFPQKDDPSKRVFAEAKLSTAIFTYLKTINSEDKKQPFQSRVHPENSIAIYSPSLSLTSEQIPLYDSSNLSIVSCSQVDWNIAIRIMKNGKLVRLSEYCTSFQGEVNETNETNAGTLSKLPTNGQLVLRGSNICLYAVRKASQGENLYLNIQKYTEAKSKDSKAFHHKHKRIGFQRSSPQNNFRRIIAAPIKEGEFCFDTISYIPVSHSKPPLGFVLALLNSKLLDWYFRLGSTNSKVNEYQFNNLPCPLVVTDGEPDIAFIKKIITSIPSENAEVMQSISHWLLSTPLSATIVHLIDALADMIVKTESIRGAIARNERSKLASSSQIYQDIIDAILFQIAGISDDESIELMKRLDNML